MLRARVIVMLKSGVLDPQGRAVQGGLHSMGYDEVLDVRVGKEILLTLGDIPEALAKERVKEMCEKLLANPVIEEYKFTIERG
ncbi:MAG: phosphoribosylformylglycinamidine synthase subunit PurS [Acidobacteria bacterium]|nr:phosphoribosylformylglycinamidine synthase subunit PurS [Acidobacteriota bacterium]